MRIQSDPLLSFRFLSKIKRLHQATQPHISSPLPVTMTALLFPSISASDDALLSSTDGTKRKFFSNDFHTDGLSSSDTVRSVRRIRQESDVEMNLSTASDPLSTENEPHFCDDQNQTDDSGCDPQLPVGDQCESVDGFSLSSATYFGSPSASSPCPSPTSSTTATISLQYEDSLYAFAFSSTLVENDDFNTWDDSFLQAPLIDFVSQLKNAFEVEDDVFVEFPQLELVFAEDSTYCEQFSLEHLMALWRSLQLQLAVKSEPLHLRVVCQKSSLQRQIDFLSSL